MKQFFKILIVNIIFGAAVTLIFLGIALVTIINLPFFIFEKLTARKS